MKYSHFFLIGLGLFAITLILSAFKGILPGIAGFIDEALFISVIVFAVFTAWNKSGGMSSTVIGVLLMLVGYKAIPMVFNQLSFFGTSNTFIGKVVDVYNDESAEGNVRRTFIIKSFETCQTDEYVSRDVVILPWVIHTDSAKTRASIVKGSTMKFSEVGTRRFKNQLPLIGNFLGLGYITGDWTSFANIYSAEQVNAPDKCEG